MSIKDQIKSQRKHKPQLRLLQARLEESLASALLKQLKLNKISLKDFIEAAAREYLIEEKKVG